MESDNGKPDKPPAFQFYPEKWLADDNIALMTNAQEGAYIRLIAHCWNRGTIPADIDTCSRLVRNMPLDQLEPVLALFVPKPGDSTRLVHLRLEKERTKQKNFRKRCSESAKKRWARERKNRE